MNGAGIFFTILALLLIAYAGWCGYRYFQARKTGERLNGWKSFVPFLSPTSSNYPTPRSAGPLEYLKSKLDTLRNKRSQTGGYENDRGLAAGAGAGAGFAGAGAANEYSTRRGRDDDAWDARVDQDPYGHGPGGYYEEQELGLGSANAGPYGADYDTGYGGQHSRGRSDGLNPFSDANAASLRSVSPRPDERPGHKRNETLTSDDGNSSPISTRKSIFREDVN